MNALKVLLLAGMTVLILLAPQPAAAQSVGCNLIYQAGDDPNAEPQDGDCPKVLPALGSAVALTTALIVYGLILRHGYLSGANTSAEEGGGRALRDAAGEAVNSFATGADEAAIRAAGKADKAVDAAKAVDKAGDAAKGGKVGRQKRLKEVANDPKASSADRGWIKNEQRQIAQGNRRSIRNPPGKDLAHERGREAAKGYDHRYSRLQDRDLHRLQHKYDNWGRKNKERRPRR